MNQVAITYLGWVRGNQASIYYGVPFGPPRTPVATFAGGENVGTCPEAHT